MAGAKKSKRKKDRNRKEKSGTKQRPRSLSRSVQCGRQATRDVDLAFDFARNHQDMASRAAFEKLDDRLIAGGLPAQEQFVAEFLNERGLSDRMLINLASALLTLTKRPYLLPLNARLLERVVGQVDPFNELLAFINHFIFSQGAALEGFEMERFRSQDLWPRYLAFVDAHFPEENDCLKPIEAPAGRRVAVVAPQILQEKHAPTKAVLELARCLKRHGGHEVLVVDACLLPPRRIGWVAAPFVAHTENRGTLTRIDDGALLLGSAEATLPYDERVRFAVELVDRFSPQVVFSYGDWNLPGDVLARRYPVVHHPSSSGAAMSLADILLYAHRHGPVVEQTHLRHRRQRGNYKPYRYIDNRIDETRPLSRQDLNLPEDRVLFALVGNRLPAELSGPFQSGVADLLEQHPMVDLVFVGHALDEHPDAFVAFCNRFRQRIWNLGYQPNLMGAYTTVDAYLNPFRQGGGQSAYLAMRAGVPVLSLNQGDVAEHLGKEHTVDTPERYFERASCWATESVARSAAAKKQREMSAEVRTLDESYPELEAFMQAAMAHKRTTAPVDRAS